MNESLFMTSNAELQYQLKFQTLVRFILLVTSSARFPPPVPNSCGAVLVVCDSLVIGDQMKAMIVL